MPKKKKLFDKKKSITFKLVHRSQRDPLIADETAPQHVLVEANHQDETKRKEEQRKYGIYFEDDYNYLQHLRDVNHTTEWEQQEEQEETVKHKPASIQLPASVFPSSVEEPEGLLNKAVLPIGPQPDWDPDVVAAMDEDFDYEDPNNQIEDDFVLQAEERMNDEEQEEEDDDNWEDVSDEEDEESDGESNFNETSSKYSDEKFLKDLYSKEETKSHFTNYSLTSSVIRRNEGLKTLDERFETLFEKEYANDCDIGALDLEDISGVIDLSKNPIVDQLIGELKNSKQQQIKTGDADIKNVIMEKLLTGEKEKFEELTDLEIPETSKRQAGERLDCESIISSYSNCYNRPKLIREENQKIKISAKTGIPIGSLAKPGLTAFNLAKLDALNKIDDKCYENTRSIGSRQSRLTTLSTRSRNETPEERRLRKAAIKQIRSERRAEKKTNRIAFRFEQIKQDNEVKNLQSRLRGVKLL